MSRVNFAIPDFCSLIPNDCGGGCAKVGVVETAADFFKKREGKATGADLMKFLRTAPKAAPEPEDEMR